MPDRGEGSDPGPHYAEGDADARIAALFEHATLVAQLRAVVGRRPHPVVAPEEPVPWEAIIEAAVNEPESVDQSLVAGIAERLGRATDEAEEGHRDNPRMHEPDSQPPAHSSRVSSLSEFVKRLIVVTGLAKVWQTWRFGRAPRD